MKRVLLVPALLLAWALLPMSPAAASGAAAGGDVIPGRYIVTLGESAHPRETAAEYDRRPGAAVGAVYRSALRGFAAELSPGELRRLQHDPRVETVEPDRVVVAQAVQSNPPWGLDRIDQRDRPLSGTYQHLQSGSGVRAYVIDTGIRASHSDFGGRVLAGYDPVGGTDGRTDCNGHGTHVAGTIGGTYAGVAKAVTLVPVRVLGCDGSGSMSHVLAGVDWVTSQPQRPAVANMSLGSAAFPTLDNAVRRSVNAGVTYVVAAGNAGADACNHSPARVGEALTVAATDSGDRRASWSNYGSCVNLFAPGVYVRSAWRTGDSDFANKSGTSMAAPHVAGVAALYLQNNPAAAPSAVRSALLEHASTGKVSDLLGSPDALAFSLFQLPDLTASTSAPPHLLRGTTGTWTITVTNRGVGQAPSTTLTVALPAQLAWGAGSTGCSFATSTRTVTCQLGTLEPGATSQVSLTAAAADVSEPTPVTVTATAAAGTAQASTSAITTLYFKRADLRTSLVGPDVVIGGEEHTYTATVFNDGPDTATATRLHLDLPLGLSPAPPAGCTLEALRLTCALGDVPAHASAPVVVVSQPPLGTRDDWVLTTSAESAEYNAGADVSDSVATAVHPGRADLALALTGPTSTSVGQDLTYRATVSNSGPDQAQATTVTAVLPAGLSFRSGPGCTSGAGAVTCVLGTLPAGETAHADVTVRADQAGTHTLSALASAAEHDARPGNNAAALSVSVPSPPGGDGGFTGGGGGGGGIAAPAPSPSPEPSPSPDPARSGSTLSQPADAGETVSTGQVTAPTRDDPVQVAVTTPVAGDVTITRGEMDRPSPGGYRLLDVQVRISAPAASPVDPLRLAFGIDRSALPAGETARSLVVFRNGAAAGDCPGADVAAPDPCVSERRDVNGDAVLTVLTSRASVWNFGVAEPGQASCAPAGFTDVDPASIHARAVDCLAELGVAHGTGVGTFGPSQPVTRGQMATFVARALEAAGFPLPPGSAGFSDTGGSVHRERVDQLVAAGIARGTSASTYEPLAPVSRAQMATFLVRAHEYARQAPLGPGTSRFTDTAGSVHRERIDQAATAGLVAGRTATTYDPATSVRRDQMATFLLRLMDALAG